MNLDKTKTIEVVQPRESRAPMFRLNKIYLVLILLVFSGMATGQDYIDIFKSDYTISPSNSIDGTAAKTHLQEMNGDLTVPIKINERFAFLTGTTYENSSASFDSSRSRESVTGLT
ncbi:MAG: hypothetical protein WED10_04450, partial [Brumimicrobium sp.]